MIALRKKPDAKAIWRKEESNNPGGNIMSIEYLLVTFPEERPVKADGNNVGFTNHTLMLPADEYVISLGGNGYQPANQDVVLAGTSVMKPMVVAFTVSVARAAKKQNA